jgi:hypothetical protein
MNDSNMRPDISVSTDDSSVVLRLDVRTCDPTLKDNVRNSSAQIGYAADRGAAEKNRKWRGHVNAQGDIFVPLCIEHAGTMGEEALAVLERAAAHFSSSMAQRTAFKTHWLQRLHMTNTRGVADLVIQNMPYYAGDEILVDHAVPNPFTAALDMAQPNPRPAARSLPTTATFGQPPHDEERPSNRPLETFV